MKQLLFLPLFFCLSYYTTTASTPGLAFNYYEGNWTTLPDFSTLTPVKQGVSNNVTLEQRNKDNQYAFLWQGYITIPADGNYTFETNSDDGSKLYLGTYKFDAIPVVNNDGEHAGRFITATIALTAGVYPFSITYFQSGGGQTMEMYWSSTSGISRQKIADNVLTVDDPRTAGLNYTYYEGTWDTLPDFRITKPVKSGVVSNINLDLRNRNVNYAFLWQGNITIPAAGDYTFETYSDDGSKLYIGSYDVDTKALVDNDFVHYNKTATGTIFLNAGVYPIAVTFFQKGGGDIMEVFWSSNTGISRQHIPDNVFGGRRTVEDPGTGSSDGLTSPTNTNYHFSSSTGNDSYSPEQALHEETPWRTIDKLNSFMPNFKPGDAVLFKRGDVFDGNIILNQSGVIGLPLIFSAYGTGSKPLINGFKTLGGWNAVGNGVWEADCNSGPFLNMVVVDGTARGMGRYPNYTDANKGYLTYESHKDSSSITDNEFNSPVNWVGAELVVRRNDWVLDRGVITNQSGKTLTFKSPTGHESRDNFGYFIQNSPLTLDYPGEWYYNPSTKKLSVYFGADNPDNHTVKASVADTLILVNDRTYITIDNLSLQGGDAAAIRLRNSSYVKFQNSDVNFTGMNGIHAYTSPYFTIENNTVNHTNNTGIKLDSSCFFALVRNNIVRNSGLIPGMGGNNNQQYDGIFSESTPSNIFELNTIDSSGYCGLTFTGDLTIVKNNFVNHFCLILNDGGGIYTWGGWNVTGREVTGNVVLNGMGAPEGTSSTVAGGAVGIYLDDRSTNVNIANNTVANCSRAGIILHNSHEIITNGNTLYNNNLQLSIVHDDLEVNDPTRNMSVINNILFTTINSQYLMENVSSLNDLDSFGAYDFNYYARPMNENGVLYSNIKINGAYKDVYYNVPQWIAKTGYDQHSVASPVKIPAYVINYITGPNKYPNGNFDANINGVDLQSSPGIGKATYSTGQLDGGALQVSFDASSGATNNVAVYLDLGPVTAGRNYLIKFSLLGSGAGKMLKAFILQNGAPWGRLSDISFFEFSSTRTENQFIFTAPSNESDIMIALEMNGPDCPYWIDNFQMNEANVTFTNPEDYIRFEYNGTHQPKTIFLDATYYDVKNNAFSGNVTMNPFTSLILMKQYASVSQSTVSNTTTAAQAAEMKQLEATALTLKLTPNPVLDKLRVAYTLPEGTKNAAISIYSISGVKQKTVNISPASNNVGIDVSTLNSGVYLMNIVYDGHVITKKFVK